MKTRKKAYTVVGLYADNYQVYVGHVKAESVAGAVANAKRNMARNCSGDIEAVNVLSVFKGHIVDQYGEDEIIED